MTESPIKVLIFQGKVKKGSLRTHELSVNYSRHNSDLLSGNWQMLIRDITCISAVKDNTRRRTPTIFTVSSNFIRSVNENNESVKTTLLIFEYKNFGTQVFYNPQNFWFYVTDKCQTASIKFEYYLGEKEFEIFDVNVSVLFRKVN